MQKEEIWDIRNEIFYVLIHLFSRVFQKKKKEKSSSVIKISQIYTRNRTEQWGVHHSRFDDFVQLRGVQSTRIRNAFASTVSFANATLLYVNFNAYSKRTYAYHTNRSSTVRRTRRDFRRVGRSIRQTARRHPQNLMEEGWTGLKRLGDESARVVNRNSV